MYDTLPDPPTILEDEDVIVRFVRMTPGNLSRGFVPGYHFAICLRDGTAAGHVNFRVGDTDHVRISAGHIGYAVDPPFRGRGLAAKACRVLAPFVAAVAGKVIITSDPDNAASIRTIGRIGAAFVDEVKVPEEDPHYARGSRRKRRYLWKPA